MTPAGPTAWIFTNRAPAEIFSCYSSINPETDFLVAADGGLARMRALGLVPGLIVGDLDSVPEELLALYPDVTLERHPRRKNETDAELALLSCLRRESRQIVLVNDLAGRFDHALALVQLLTLSAGKGRPASLEAERQRLFFLEPDTRIPDCAGCHLSLLAWQEPAFFGGSEGLEYPLTGVTLTPQLSRGISNRVLSADASIRLTGGRALAILSK